MGFHMGRPAARQLGDMDRVAEIISVSPVEATGDVPVATCLSRAGRSMSVPQVARLLQCSERWLYGKVRDGDLQATHLGRAVRISRAHLQRFLDTRNAWVPPVR